MSPRNQLSLVSIKIDWAKRQLEELGRTKQRFMDRQPYGTAVETDLEAGRDHFKMLYVEPIDLDIALIAGDVIHNTRSALDHLAWQLVLANGQQPTRHTCFPIYKDVTSYKALDARKVNGMAQIAKDIINIAEPYQGGKGHDLWILHELDIADKHRALLTAITCLGRVSIQAMDSVSLYNVPSVYEAFGSFTAPGFNQALKADDVFFTCEAGKVKETQFTFEIGISEPCIGSVEPIIPYLDFLIDRAQLVIADFKSLLI